MSLKDKFNAKSAEEAAKSAQDAEATRLYRGRCLREYPRLTLELHERTKSLLSGVDKVRIIRRDVPESLSYKTGGNQTGFTTHDIGNVASTHTRVEFQDRWLEFEPAGIGYLGARALINIKKSRPHAYQDAALYMNDASREDPETWELFLSATKGEKPALLTDAMLEAVFEKCLL